MHEGTAPTQLTRETHSHLVIRTKSGAASVATSYLWTHMLLEAKVLTFLGFIDTMAMFMRLPLMIMYLSCDFGLSDYTASMYFAYHGIACVVYSMVFNAMCNYMPPVRLLWLGSVFEVAGTTILVVTETLFFVQLSLFVILPIGIALGGPVVTKLTKQYVFSPAMDKVNVLMYIIGNIGAGAAFLLSDALQMVAMRDQWALTSYRAVFFASACLEMVYLIIVFFNGLRPNVFVDQHGLVWSTTSAADASMCGRSRKNKNRDANRSNIDNESVWSGVKNTVSDPIFWKLVAIVFVFAIGTGTVHRFTETVYPKVMERTFGGDSAETNHARGCLVNSLTQSPEVDPKGHAHVPWNALLAIDPFVCIVCSYPLNTLIIEPYMPLMSRFITGAVLTSTAVVALVVSMSYGGVVVFITFLSLAEVVWAPSLSAFATKLAPHRYVGIWMSVAGMPRIVAKFFSGVIGAVLLERFCPDADNCHTQMLWLAALFISALTPLALLLMHHTGLVRDMVASADAADIHLLPVAKTHSAADIPFSDSDGDIHADGAEDGFALQHLEAFARAAEEGVTVVARSDDTPVMTRRGEHGTLFDTSAFADEHYGTVGGPIETLGRPVHPSEVNPYSLDSSYVLQ